MITPEEVLTLTEEALREYANGDAVNPSKLSLPIWPYHEGLINSMPSYLKKADIAGVKIVSVFDRNPHKYGLPTTVGTIILYDPETGLPYSIMDGTYITDLRTGAVSGIKAKYLSRKDAKKLAIVGAGVHQYANGSALSAWDHPCPGLRFIGRAEQRFHAEGTSSVPPGPF